MMADEAILQEIYAVIQQRKNASPEESYVALLLSRGLDKILAKIGEEATETAIAGKGGVRAEMVHEVADLFFHVLVLLGYYDISPDEIWAELRRRFGTSGLEEKRSRAAGKNSGRKTS
ncbi:MAG: phosphoribosyl-ATP diphosphatase [Deltaproteobacteria bacterium]|nr:phosphoribosyl-ATP diphosphatase [Deltaproteobacteria bacterium]